jgi:hypothetical protein
MDFFYETLFSINWYTKYPMNQNTQNILKTIVINVLKHKNTILTSWKAFKMTYFGKLLNKNLRIIV